MREVETTSRLWGSAFAAGDVLVQALAQLKASERRELGSLGPDRLYNALLAEVMCDVVQTLAQARRLPWSKHRRGSRLWGATLLGAFGAERPLSSWLDAKALHAAHEALRPEQFAAEASLDKLGGLFESMRAWRLEHDGSRFVLVKSPERKASGSFFTPERLTQQVVERALEPLLKDLPREPTRAAKSLLRLKICDPAVGAGAFLLEVARQLSRARAEREKASAKARAEIAASCLFGVDENPLAVAMTEACLWLWVSLPEFSFASLRTHLKQGDALVGCGFETSAAERAALSRLPEPERSALRFDWGAAFPEQRSQGFDLVVGNPPWVAYAGRSAQPLAAWRKDYYRSVYTAYRGFPTLHALFIERAAALARRGRLALLIPSPVADLDGYRPARAGLTRTHRVREPLLEFGQDAFEQVTQPCFALQAEPAANAAMTDGPWPLVERQHSRAKAAAVQVPEALLALSRLAPLPHAAFKEMGFQTSRFATQTLLLRTARPDSRFRYPLLEGRNVSEFKEDGVRLFLWDDPEKLREAGCRLRPRDAYKKVAFVVRQTANVPIAALHNGLPFRNSLLAGFSTEEHSALLLVGLLNSALYRALHLARRRDARQAAFPQVKLSHLRSLPKPPKKPAPLREVERITQLATSRGLSDRLRSKLDERVFELFGVAGDQRVAIYHFLRALAPRLGYR